MDTIILDGAWTVRAEDFGCAGGEGLARVLKFGDGWIPSQVPGEIHLDLMRAGMMPEPSIGENMPGCRWPETKSWWYRTSFSVGDRFLLHERQQLIFDGLDLNAQVFLNGALIGTSRNAFIPIVFDARGKLLPGRNELVVRLTAGSELALDDTPPGQGKPERKPAAAAGGAIPSPRKGADLYGHRGWPGRKWLRKPQFVYGWDWVDALPTIGIWRGVRIEGRSHAILQDVRFDTVLADGGAGQSVALSMEAVLENLHAFSERRCLLDLQVTGPEGEPAARKRWDLDVVPGRMPIRDMVEIPDGRLWWPNGLGEQPLYHVSVKVSDADGLVRDRRELTLGLRTIDIDRSRMNEGSRFCIRVNGVDVFCRGANVGPHDSIPARITREKYEALVSEAKNAHMNMLRINGCSFYESGHFYDACDRAGILVWQDFMLTDMTYPDGDPGFISLVAEEAASVIRLLRHHPSIALWCGNNECQQVFDIWNPDKGGVMDVGGQRLYNQVLPETCMRLDPQRPYWPGSPCGGAIADAELSGDNHWWFAMLYTSDMNRKLTHDAYDLCRARFVSEYGVLGPCHVDSIREYLGPGGGEPGDPAWQVHTNMCDNGIILNAIRLHYRDTEGISIEHWSLYGQLYQALIHGHAMEAFRFRKGDPVDDCQGSLLWSFSDCWGETGWSILDYSLRRKASYYWVRRACAPVKVIVRRRGEALRTRVINDTLRPLRGSVRAGWWRLDGSETQVESLPVAVPANGMTEVTSALIPTSGERDPHHWLYAAVLFRDDGLAVDQSLWPLLPHRELATATPSITVTDGTSGMREISSPVYCHAVHVEDHGRELVSDNWFDLLPGVPVRVRLAGDALTADLRFEAVGRP